MEKKNNVVIKLSRLFKFLQQLEINNNPYPQYEIYKKLTKDEIKQLHINYLSHFKNDDFQKFLLNEIYAIANSQVNEGVINKNLFDILQLVERYLEYTLAFQQKRSFNFQTQNDDDYWREFYTLHSYNHCLFYNLMLNVWTELNKFISNSRFKEISKFHLNGYGIPKPNIALKIKTSTPVFENFLNVENPKDFAEKLSDLVTDTRPKSNAQIIGVLQMLGCFKNYSFKKDILVAWYYFKQIPLAKPINFESELKHFDRQEEIFVLVRVAPDSLIKAIANLLISNPITK